MKIDIDNLTEAELVDLNNRIIQRLRFLQQMRAHTSMLEFSLGERVCFQPDGQPLIFGVITRYNKKTVTVITDGGEHWNVAPSVLRKAITEATPVESSNVVPFQKKLALAAVPNKASTRRAKTHALDGRCWAGTAL